MIDLANDLVQRATLLGYAVFALVVIYTIGRAYLRSGGALVPTVVAGVVGGLALWLAYNFLRVRDAFNSDLGAAPAGIGRAVASHYGLS